MRVEVCPVSSLPADRGTRVIIGDHRIALFRVGGEVYAISDRCSHAEASLAEGYLFDTTVECPRHGSEFDLITGEPSSLPATTAVPTYAVEIDEGVVYLNLENVG